MARSAIRRLAPIVWSAPLFDRMHDGEASRGLPRLAPWSAVAAAMALLALGLAREARAVADGTPLSVVTRQSVFGSSIGVGNTLMEHDGRVNFAVRVEGSQATIPLDDVRGWSIQMTKTQTGLRT